MSYRVALLIDAENVSSAYAGKILNVSASYGEIVYKHIFGSAAALNPWADVIYKNLMTPHFTIAAVKGKNTADIELTIFAMDVLLHHKADSFVIVSSDSDFSPLAIRIRRAGCSVIGMGKSNSVSLWRNACTDFFSLDEGNAVTETAKEPDTSSIHMDSGETVSDRAYSAREKIKDTIRDIIIHNGGEIQSSSLFNSLKNNSDYKQDRKAANIKKSNDYITFLFGDDITILKKDGIDWVSLRSQKNNDKKRVVCDALAQNGIPADCTEKIADIIIEHGGKSQAAYVEMRKLFGNSSGLKYYRIAKAAYSAAIQQA